MTPPRLFLLRESLYSRSFVKPHFNIQSLPETRTKGKKLHTVDGCCSLPSPDFFFFQKRDRKGHCEKIKTADSGSLKNSPRIDSIIRREANQGLTPFPAYSDQEGGVAQLIDFRESGIYSTW